jgi:ATP-dependent DNA helicase DinG
MGLPEDTREFQALSPFDYGRRSVLYLPTHLPVHPNNDKMCLDKEAALEEYFDALTKEIVRLVKISKGHAFILCSARSEMQELFNRTRTIIGYPTRIQEAGMSAGALEEWFRTEVSPVLFATKSFWEGVSIEGAQLRMVIIPKVPFPVPSDPVFKAKETALKEKGLSGFDIFKKLSVPAMIMDVQQGLGRLIRTMDDFGVAAILDNRVTPGSKNFKRGYANTLLQALPFTVQVQKLDVVRQAMEIFIGK